MRHFLLIATAFFCLSAFSQINPETSFGVNGLAKVDFGSDFPTQTQMVRKIFPQDDGSYYTVITINGETVLTRYLADGSRDLNYGVDGFSEPVGVQAVDAVWQNGKILVAGWVYSEDLGYYTYGVARFNTNGTLDAGFGTNGKATASFDYQEDGFSWSNPQTVAINGDNIIVAGYAYTNDGGQFALINFNRDGSLNTSFGNNGKVLTPFYYTYTSGENTYTRSEAYATAVIIKGDKIVVAGRAYYYSPSPDNSNWYFGNYKFALARYNSDGSLDESFGDGGTASTPFNFDYTYSYWNGTTYTTQTTTRSEAMAFSVALLGDKIVLGGYASDENYSRRNFALARYNNDGSLDPTFGNDGTVRTAISNYNYWDEGITALVVVDEKVIAAGRSYISNGTQSGRGFTLVRYEDNGALDESFGTDGKVITFFPKPSNTSSWQGDAYLATVAVYNSKLIAGGYSSHDGSGTYITLGRYSLGGALDESFGIGGKVREFKNTGSSWFAKAIKQPDGKIVAVGTSYRGHEWPVYKPNAIALARFNPDGTLDQSFGDAGKVVTPYDFSVYGNESSFQPTSIVLQGDKIVIGGSAYYNTPNTVGWGFYNYKFSLFRYNSDGSLDEGFGEGGIVSTTFDYERTYTYYDYESGTEKTGTVTISNAYLTSLAVDGDEIIAGGSAIVSHDNQYYELWSIVLARYNQNGSLDESFGTSGKVATTFANPDGSVTGAYGWGSSVAMYGDKIILGGYVRQIENGVHNWKFALARYATTGSLDAGFGTDGKVTTPFYYEDGTVTRSAAWVETMTISGDKIFLGGSTGFIENNQWTYPFALAAYHISDGALDASFGTGGIVTTKFDHTYTDGWDGTTTYTRSSAWIEDIAVVGSHIIAAGRAENSNMRYSLAAAKYKMNGALDQTYGHLGTATSKIEWGRATLIDGKLYVAGSQPFYNYYHDVSVLGKYTVPSSAKTITCPTDQLYTMAAGVCSSTVTDADAVPFPSDEAYNYKILKGGEQVASGTGSITGQVLAAGVYSVTYSLADDPETKCSFTITINPTLTTYYADTDGDGYGDPNNSEAQCTAPEGYITQGGDCDDSDPAINPAAAEVCDDKDNNCDGQIDEGLPTSIYYKDNDRDGYGDPNNPVQKCFQPTGFVTDNTDCNDNNAGIHPAGTDTPDDNIDQDCDGADLKTWYEDKDGDSYGNAASIITHNDHPIGYVARGGDCNDNNAAVNPGATEICGNGIDDNCDGQIDEGCNNTLKINISDATVYEVDKVARLIVSLTKASDKSITVSYATANGTAKVKGTTNNPADYKAVSGKLTFLPGEMIKEITVSILSEVPNVKEQLEYFTVELSKPDRGGIEKGTGTVTILDDKPVTLSMPVSVPEESSVKSLTVRALPNPSWGYFTLTIQSGSVQQLQVKVLDVLGRVIEARSNMAPNGIVTFGNNYRPGIYYVEVVQGAEKRILKLVKQ